MFVEVPSRAPGLTKAKRNAWPGLSPAGVERASAASARPPAMSPSTAATAASAGVLVMRVIRLPFRWGKLGPVAVRRAPAVGRSRRPGS